MMLWTLEGVLCKHPSSALGNCVNWGKKRLCVPQFVHL